MSARVHAPWPDVKSLLTWRAEIIGQNTLGKTHVFSCYVKRRGARLAPQTGARTHRPPQDMLPTDHTPLYGQQHPTRRTDWPKWPSEARRPAGIARANRAPRDLARQHGRRTRRAAHHRTRLAFHAATAPKIAATRHAQRAQHARTAAPSRGTRSRACAHEYTCAMRSARYAARSAAAGASRSRS